MPVTTDPARKSVVTPLVIIAMGAVLVLAADAPAGEALGDDPDTGLDVRLPS